MHRTESINQSIDRANESTTTAWVRTAMPSGASASFAWSDGTSVSQFNNLLGTRVRLVGLTNRPELNGQCGEVLSWDSASGRAGVKLDNEAARPIKVKPANLQPVGGEDDPGVGAPDDSTPATFHPNIMFTYPARVLGVTTVTTNDFMSSGYEERHFIDRAFLERLPGGADLLASVVPAQPPCFKLVGAGFRATVLGMLWNALPVTMDVVPDGPIVDPSSGHTLDLSLAHILVVENLPVEIHVSWKVLFSTETLAVVRKIANFVRNSGRSGIGATRTGPGEAPS